MAEISIVGPADGETALSGPATVRIIEDGSTTSHRLGMAEIALLGSPRVSGVVLVDAAGLAIEDYPAPDFFSLSMDQVAELS